ncbi:DNA polymerase III subunit chi [Xinfangfangia pollutisoli]|uniref:DNA polymerase III subunit chi n=1 Tax=Xinfangfangia pollutisoli TaxID=2865960 RepID=UPI001CD63CD6|nr:DNA polymerase III subunit chi [Xinfangfangia pollutisoli]
MVVFMQLTRSTVEETVLLQAGRALKQGWRVMLRAARPEQLARLDDWLWLHPEDGFLPHGREDAPQAEAQPLLLGLGAPVNGAQAVLLLGGLAVDPDEARRMERIWLLFEGEDPAQLQAARAQWKAVTAAGLTAQYHSEESGRWQLKAESAAKA